MEFADRIWLYGTIVATSLLVVALAILIPRIVALQRQVQTEVERRHELERDLRDASNTDTGTGVLNRRGMERLAVRELHRANRNGAKVSIMSLELDAFRRIREEHGHSSADHVLESFARTCRSCLRRVDVLARTGGEEFSVLLPETDADGAVEVAMRIREKLENHPFPLLRGGRLGVTTSIGIAERQEDENFERLMGRSAYALDAARNDGRDCVRLA